MSPCSFQNSSITLHRPCTCTGSRLHWTNLPRNSASPLVRCMCGGGPSRCSRAPRRGACALMRSCARCSHATWVWNRKLCFSAAKPRAGHTCSMPTRRTSTSAIPAVAAFWRWGQEGGWASTLNVGIAGHRPRGWPRGGLRPKRPMHCLGWTRNSRVVRFFDCGRRKKLRAKQPGPVSTAAWLHGASRSTKSQHLLSRCTFHPMREPPLNGVSIDCHPPRRIQSRLRASISSRDRKVIEWFADRAGRRSTQ